MAIPALARLAAAVLTNEDGRRTAGKVLALILSPLIILAAFLCCFGDGASRHNNAVVSAAFYGAEFSDKVPKEYRTHITEMQEAFSLLDSATVYVNQKAEEGSLDPVQVKAVFFALCFGDNAPTRAAADRFVDCFYKTETRTRMVTVVQEDGTEELVEETYEVAVPLSVEDVYEKLTTWRGRVVTDAERSNAVDIYAIVMGSMGGDTFNGDYESGGSATIELDVSMLTDPTTKNAADLVTYVTNAWTSGWGYVWGTYGQVLTPELLQYKLTQYPDGVGKYAAFIRANWLGRHTADCVGLIKGYGWLSTDTMTIDYGIPNIRGGTTWGHSAVRGILSNEKYVGDVLMQKTFRQDCISHKAIRNTGQRPMYLVQNNHEAIIDRKTYNAAQTELARRTAIKGTTEKSTPSGRSSYMPMYALSERVFCGECGTRYRRCTWVNNGKKHIVWRCVSRIDYGKKYCHTSPSVDEQQLQQAILRAINSIMSDKTTLVRQVTENLQVVIHPSQSGELTIAEIDHQLETLAQEFDTVFTTVTSGNSADYIERFKVIFAQQAELKAKRAELKQQQTEDAELTSHMELAADTLEQAGTAITEWDEYQIRALVESVRILSKDEVLVRLKSGIEKIEKLRVC